MRDMRRQLLIAVVTGVGMVTMAAPAIGATEGLLVRESPTDWATTPSPDPTGLTYDPRSHKLWLSDSEVDETGLWKHRNLFLATRRGGLRGTGRLVKATSEPEGISWYPRGKSLFVVDDDKNAIFRFGPGRDGKIGTRDDKVRELVDTLRFGSKDAEGVTWHSRRGRLDMLIWVDARDRNIYELKRGRDHRFGTKDDVMRRKFATTSFGRPFTDPDGVYFDRRTGHLFSVSSNQHFVLETTLTGQFVQWIDMRKICRISLNGCEGFSDLVFAPGTDGSRRRLYLTDKRVDNNVEPSENDGMLYQVELVDVPVP